MANTIMSAKNSFLEGLVMDFAPSNAQATCMTSALNATLLTFNGNEMSLLNDMGNARVETACLPEGYVPVGSCEFGDIIYIVSYNPLTDKSQIGCFPSPERNISTEETHNTGLIIKSSDFQEFNGNKPTGKLLTNSVKKVLINTKKLNAGDKYIIYTNSSSITLNYSKLSDCIKDGVEQHENLPKNVKLHVVSIEDSGKITYLDSTTKWYNTEDYKYYLSSKKIGNNSNTDLDEYRNLVSSNWSIFSSKVSGKLAILAELETPETFSCSWDLLSLEPFPLNGIIYKRYTLNLLPNTDSKITPKYICLTKALFDYSKPNFVLYGEGIEYKAIGDDLTGDVYEYGNPVKIATITIPYKDSNGNLIKSKSFIFNIDVVPAMDYGLVESLKTSLTIDFNLVGTGDIDLHTWKYHNSENTSVLTFGINAYPKPNWEVNNIVMQFFDNLGLVAEYLLNDKKSYSGLFTEYIGLNNKVSNSRISRSRSDNNGIIYHKGDPIDKIIGDNIDNYTTSECSKVTEKYEGQVYLNDAGTLYSGFLYAVKIIVTQLHINNPNTKDTQTKYRWYWTNPMFNEYYYSVKDFDILNFELILNGEAMFETSQYYIWKQKELNNLNNDFNAGENYKTNSANVQYIGYGNENNLNMYIYAGLQNDYGCFNLIQAPSKDKDDISGIDLKIYLGESNINYSIPEKLYEFSVKEETPNNPTYLALNNSVNKDGEIVISADFNTFLENPETLLNTQANDKFNIYFSEYLYEDKLNTWKDSKVPEYVTTLDKCYFESNDNKVSIPLSMLAILFNKAYTLSNTQGNILVPVYTPIIDSLEELNSLGIIGSVDNKDIVTLSFRYAVALSHAENLFSATKLHSDKGVFSTADSDDDDWKFEGPDRLIDTATNTDFLDKIWGNINPDIDLFFPVYLGGYGSNNSYGTKYYSAISGSAKNYIPTNKWRWIVKSSNDERENSKLTEGAFDIDGANIVKADSLKSASFLGVKYKNGMTIINNAFRDSVSDEGDQFKQQAINYSTYSNFAYLLYLLLTNTYHKNKRVLDLKINLKNYVRNDDYDIELVKHVIIELSAKGLDMNITLRGINFKDYRDTILGHEDLKGHNLSSKNVSLKLLSFANDHELKILVKSLPMSFFNNEVEAYIKRFGMLYPVNDLSPNNFYVYLNGELIQYSNGTLIFSETDVKESLKHIFKDDVKESPTLGGAKRKTSTIIDDVDLGYNEYVDYVRNYMTINTGEESVRYTNLNDAKLAYVNNMFDTLPDSLYGYSKNEFREDTTSIINRILAVVLLEGFYIVRVLTNALQELLLKKTGKSEVSPNYEFITHRFLNIFDYLNEFITKSTLLLGSSFGIKDGGNDKNSAYTGFARDILLDTDYLVV